ncbi:MAG: Ig-like domain-containing protein [Gemmatimonadaceae bacterium]|nr:Ig-like domain-containing protein [Gemmatimonadaceae bacterium]
MKKLGLLFVLAVFSACKTDTFTDVPTNSNFYFVRLTPSAASLGVGQTQQVSVTAFDAGPCGAGPCSPVTPGNVITVAGTPTYRSTDTTRVRVSSSGLVTAIATGTAGVIATLQDIPGYLSAPSVTRVDTAFFTVTATPVSLASLTLTANRNTTGAGSPDTLIVTLKDAAGVVINTQQAATITGTNVGRPKFYTSNPEIATVGLTGIISGVTPGAATITAVISVGGAIKTATFPITVTAPVTGTFAITTATSGTGILFFPSTLTVSATQAKLEGRTGATVTFSVTSGTFSTTTTPNSTQCFNVTFANPAAAQATTPTGLSGNIGTGAAGSANGPLCSGSQSRLFTTPGTYTFTSTTNGAAGTLIVQ